MLFASVGCKFVVNGGLHKGLTEGLTCVLHDLVTQIS